MNISNFFMNFINLIFKILDINILILMKVILFMCKCGRRFKRRMV